MTRPIANADTFSLQQIKAEQILIAIENRISKHEIL